METLGAFSVTESAGTAETSEDQLQSKQTVLGELRQWWGPPPTHTPCIGPGEGIGDLHHLFSNDPRNREDGVEFCI